MGMRSFVFILKTSLKFTFYEYIYDMHTSAKIKKNKANKCKPEFI